MGVSFDTPLALLLLIPLLGITIGLYLTARRRVGAGRRRFALVLRTVLLTALVLALAGFRIVLPVDRLATVFVVDMSDSVATRVRRMRSRSCERPWPRCPTGTWPGSWRSASRRWSSGCRPRSRRSRAWRRRR
jgi:hypothetical protein